MSCFDDAGGERREELRRDFMMMLKYARRDAFYRVF